jgi:adenylyltransferase/sulfurtransferase
MLKKISVLLILLFVAACANQDSTASDKAEIAVHQVKTKIDSMEQILLLDVRTEGEYDGALGHINSSILIPLDELEDRIAELEPYKNREIIVICRSGNRSGYATRMLRGEGFNALNMLGGMLKWNDYMDSHKEEEMK